MTSSFPAAPRPEQTQPEQTAPEPDVAGQPVFGVSADAAGPGVSGGGAGLVRLTDLLGTRREISILHGEAVYTLRLTSNNRLILTK